MMRKKLFGLVALLVIAPVFNPVSAVSTGNRGQPSQSCQAFFGDSGPFIPVGFNTDGFNFATTRYAGSGFAPNADNPHAVSQYDVACFQQFQKL